MCICICVYTYIYIYTHMYDLFIDREGEREGYICIHRPSRRKASAPKRRRSSAAKRGWAESAAAEDAKRAAVPLGRLCRQAPATAAAERRARRCIPGDGSRHVTQQSSGMPSGQPAPAPTAAGAGPSQRAAGQALTQA